MENDQIPTVFRNMIKLNNRTEEDRPEDVKYREIVEFYSKSLLGKNELINNFESINKEMIRMGFEPRMIFRSFLVSQYNTVEQGIELLSKTTDLWNHKYIDCCGKCFICNHKEEHHNVIEKETQNVSISNKIKIAFINHKSDNINFNDDRTKISLVSCPICFMEIDSDNKYIFRCKHEFCKDCITMYVEEMINNSKVVDMSCPLKKCDTIFTEQEIKSLTNEMMYAKYEKFIQREKIKNDPNLILCPIVNCEGYANMTEHNNLLNEDDTLVTRLNVGNRYMCNNNHAFCGNCNLAWHGDTNCTEDSEIKDYATNSGYILKKCPKCKVWIEKNRGCNMMKCEVCNIHFCWICETETDYEHFNIEDTPCYGKLYDHPNPDAAILNRLLLSSYEYLIFFGLIHFFYLLYNILVRIGLQNNHSGCVGKIAFFIKLSLTLILIWFIFILCNMILLCSMMVGTKMISSFVKYNYVSFLYKFVCLIMYFIFFLPSILFTSIWYVSLELYILIKIIIT
jgi:E3 ubiquitin-protein ligase RNF144